MTLQKKCQFRDGCKEEPQYRITKKLTLSMGRVFCFLHYCDIEDSLKAMNLHDDYKFEELPVQ